MFQVKVPKFEIETDTDVSSIAAKLGISALFRDEADFSKVRLKNKNELFKNIFLEYLQISDLPMKFSTITQSAALKVRLAFKFILHLVAIF